MASEMKVVIVVKDSRGSIGIQVPECDPVFQVLQEGGLTAAIAKIPELVQQAEEHWKASPRYPKTTIVTPLPTSTPARTATPAAAAKKPEPGQPKMF